MTKWGRIKMILSSLLMIFSAFLLIISQEDAFDVIAALLSIYLIAYAIREFHYFFTLARFMVGGKYLFYRAILALDFGIFAVTMTRMPSEIILFFLCASFIFTGVIDILKSMDSKKWAEAGGSVLPKVHSPFCFRRCAWFSCGRLTRPSVCSSSTCFTTP
ncbi:MAG: DUF308 domain-containing protein [Solobacterium sp.]|nr:DUF308 domain-containing protein [Solobacterium sp.]